MDREERRATLQLRFASLAFFLSIVLAVAAPEIASAQTIWLDAPLQQWNAAGASVPPAPPADAAVQARCRAQERPASNAAEQQLAAAGWHLTSATPTVTQGNAAIIYALVNYDGMCRPRDFNYFVFANGQFAGTLSPVNLESREDGVSAGPPSFLPDGRISATFLRYKPTDPLCCPSSPSDRVLYAISSTSAGPVVAAQSITPLTLTPTPTPYVPTRASPTPSAVAGLPQTGEPGLTLPIGILGAMTLVLAGVVLRRVD